jgi:DNA-binding response OmpR family regulator
MPTDLPGLLIVEDEPTVLTLLEFSTRSRFRVFRATSGQEAIQTYREHAGTICLALIDLQLPDTTGAAILAALRAVKPDLACCVMGGDIEDDDRLKNNGAVAVFQKPFAMGETAEALASICGRLCSSSCSPGVHQRPPG